jgi:hypothetical protein
MAQGILDVLNQIGRGFERIYDENIGGLLGSSPAQAAPVADTGNVDWEFIGALEGNRINGYPERQERQNTRQIWCNYRNRRRPWFKKRRLLFKT